MIGGLFLNSKSRTQYSAYNTSIALFSRAAAILIGYVVRVVFTHVLSENYVGINGLFTDILNVLSLSEMGIETAISFALYKPIGRRQHGSAEIHYAPVSVVLPLCGCVCCRRRNLCHSVYGHFN